MQAVMQSVMQAAVHSASVRFMLQSSAFDELRVRMGVVCARVGVRPVQNRPRRKRKIMSEVVTIARFTEPLEAEMAKLRLESAGIEVFLSGENAAIMEPGLGSLELQVSSEDETDARAILADPGEAESGEEGGGAEHLS